MLKKTIFALAILLLAITNSIALSNTSGDYVYYRDFSFTREAYVGFLYYDESTYRVRFLAPATETLPLKMVDILFSVDAKKGRFELTGERFVTPPQPDDTEIINYIHDLLYELSARHWRAVSSFGGQEDFALVDYSKSKVPFMQAGLSVQEDFSQFGGNVTMLYDAVVPIFNLKKIVDYSGKDVFVVSTIGTLSDSADKSFERYVPSSLLEKRKADSVPYADKVALTLREEVNQSQAFVQSVTADGNWALAGENIWMLKNSAFISLSGFKMPADFAKKSVASATANVIRTFAASNGYTYSDWSALDVHVKGTLIKISSQTYNPKTENLVTDIKTLSRAAANFYGCFSLTIFTEDYKKNRPYFDKIAKSYSYKFTN